MKVAVDDRKDEAIEWPESRPVEDADNSIDIAGVTGLEQAPGSFQRQGS